MKRVNSGAVRTYDASTESGVSSLLQDVARPFAEPTPCGRDVAYDGEFLRLKEEIDRLNAVDLRVDQQQATALTQALKEAHGQQRRPNGNASSAQGSSFDADLVVSLAHAILRDHSKDLRVAAYLALGLARRMACAASRREVVRSRSLCVSSGMERFRPQRGWRDD
jgi:hypothetical protein